MKVELHARQTGRAAGLAGGILLWFSAMAAAASPSGDIKSTLKLVANWQLNNLVESRLLDSETRVVAYQGLSF